MVVTGVEPRHETDHSVLKRFLSIPRQRLGMAQPSVESCNADSATSRRRSDGAWRVGASGSSNTPPAGQGLRDENSLRPRLASRVLKWPGFWGGGGLAWQGGPLGNVEGPHVVAERRVSVLSCSCRSCFSSASPRECQSLRALSHPVDGGWRQPTDASGCGRGASFAR